MIIALLVSGGLICIVSTALMIAKAVGDWPKQLLLSSIQIIAALFIMYGVVGFFGASIAVQGGLNWLPDSVELPMRFVEGVVTDRDGNLYCPSKTYGRIQAYDRDKKFLRGWFVQTDIFKIRMTAQEQLDVVTTRDGVKRYVFDLNGELISESAISLDSYLEFDREGKSIKIPCPIFLLPLTTSFNSWLMVAFGVFLYAQSTSKKRSINKRLNRD